MRRACVGSLLVGGALLSGCGTRDHVLEGSLTEVLDLDYQKVDVVRNPDDLAVRFLMPQGAGDNVVLRLSVDLAGTTIDANKPFDLASTGLQGNQRGSISRSVLDDPLTSFPLLVRGELTFDHAPLAGEKVSGDFRATFENGTELASGRTVFGTFEATVQ
jgi:hypothetical protein